MPLGADKTYLEIQDGFDKKGSNNKKMRRCLRGLGIGILVFFHVAQFSLAGPPPQKERSKKEEGIAGLLVPLPKEFLENGGDLPLFSDFPVCGNGIVEPPEECDDGNFEDTDGCANDCTVNAVCGDGKLDPSEMCDDGNQKDGDGCSSDCKIESGICGNGQLEEGEACDDGNRKDGDGCSHNCTLEVICGNGLVEPPEECDDGNTTDFDGCSSHCRLEVCGDGIVQPWEECETTTDCPEGMCAQCRCEGCPPTDACQANADCPTTKRLVGNDCLCFEGLCGTSSNCPNVKICQEGASKGGCWDKISQTTQSFTSPEGCQIECHYEVRTCGGAKTTALVASKIVGGTYQTTVGQQIIDCFCTTQQPVGATGDLDESNACQTVTIAASCPSNL